MRMEAENGDDQRKETAGHLGRERVPYIKIIIPITTKTTPPIKTGTFSKPNHAMRAATTPAIAKPIPNHLIRSLLGFQTVFYSSKRVFTKYFGLKSDDQSYNLQSMGYITTAQI
jgi:hypothetical protein